MATLVRVLHLASTFIHTGGSWSVYGAPLSFDLQIVATLDISFNSNEFDRVLLVKPSMFGKLEVHVSEVVWRFEPITFYIGDLRVKLILATHALCLFCLLDAIVDLHANHEKCSMVFSFEGGF